MVSSFKTAVSLEEAGRVQIVALDKTGTITSGEPRVTDLVCEPGYDEKTLLELAGALEKKSEHPLAKAVLLEIAQRKIYHQRSGKTSRHWQEMV